MTFYFSISILNKIKILPYIIDHILDWGCTVKITHEVRNPERVGQYSIAKQVSLLFISYLF
jgi:hypothetical protein